MDIRESLMEMGFLVPGNTSPDSHSFSRGSDHYILLPSSAKYSTDPTPQTIMLILPLPCSKSIFISSSHVPDQDQGQGFISLSILD